MRRKYITNTLLSLAVVVSMGTATLMHMGYAPHFLYYYWKMCCNNLVTIGGNSFDLPDHTWVYFQERDLIQIGVLPNGVNPPETVYVFVHHLKLEPHILNTDWNKNYVAISAPVLISSFRAPVYKIKYQHIKDLNTREYYEGTTILWSIPELSLIVYIENYQYDDDTFVDEFLKKLLKE